MASQTEAIPPEPEVLARTCSARHRACRPPRAASVAFPFVCRLLASPLPFPASRRLGRFRLAPRLGGGLGLGRGRGPSAPRGGRLGVAAGASSGTSCCARRFARRTPCRSSDASAAEKPAVGLRPVDPVGQPVERVSAPARSSSPAAERTASTPLRNSPAALAPSCGSEPQPATARHASAAIHRLDMPRSWHPPAPRGAGCTERRRNRTYPPPGYDGQPVLKTGWGTSPVPLRGRG